MRILVRLVLNRKFLETISRCCAILSSIEDRMAKTFFCFFFLWWKPVILNSKAQKRPRNFYGANVARLSNFQMESAFMNVFDSFFQSGRGLLWHSQQKKCSALNQHHSITNSTINSFCVYTHMYVYTHPLTNAHKHTYTHTHTNAHFGGCVDCLQKYDSTLEAWCPVRVESAIQDLGDSCTPSVLLVRDSRLLSTWITRQLMWESREFTYLSTLL